LAFHLGELGDAHIAQVGAHLSSCARCEQQARQLDALSDSALSALQALKTCALESPLAADRVFAGRFKLRQKLGEGGMGEVWVADQIEPVQRRVALKVVRAGLDSTRLLARFNHERQALALMEHPNIAKVLDAGIDEAARGLRARSAGGMLGRMSDVTRVLSAIEQGDCSASRPTNWRP